MADPQRRRDGEVAAGLLEQPGASVDEHNGEVRGGGASRHVARVLRVPRVVADDERARRCREVPIGNVDRDPLLAFRPQAVGDEGEVEAFLPTALRRRRDRVDLVVEQALRVVEEPPDERALAVVDRSDGREPQQLARLCAHRSHQK